MDNSWDWADELISQRSEPIMELPEDVLIMMMRKNPLLEELMDKLELEMEL